MSQPRSRNSERRCSTRWRAPAGLHVRIRRVGRRSEKLGVLRDLSASGALIELASRLPLGTLLQLDPLSADVSSLVTVVRTGLADDFTRTYGVACFHGELQVERFFDPQAAECDERDPLALRWPATRSEIRRAYRSLALKFHPDVGGTEAGFRSLHQAYVDALNVASN